MKQEKQIVQFEDVVKSYKELEKTLQDKKNLQEKSAKRLDIIYKPLCIFYLVIISIAIIEAILNNNYQFIWSILHFLAFVTGILMIGKLFD